MTIVTLLSKSLTLSLAGCGIWKGKITGNNW